jgi:hypothetical protein
MTGRGLRRRAGLTRRRAPVAPRPSLISRSFVRAVQSHPELRRVVPHRGLHLLAVHAKPHGGDARRPGGAEPKLDLPPVLRAVVAVDVDEAAGAAPARAAPLPLRLRVLRCGGAWRWRRGGRAGAGAGAPGVSSQGKAVVRRHGVRRMRVGGRAGLGRVVGCGAGGGVVAPTGAHVVEQTLHRCCSARPRVHAGFH